MSQKAAMTTPWSAPAVDDDGWAGANPFDAGFRDDPHPALRRLRERDPVNETPVGIWRLTRYADVDRLLHRTPCGVRTTDGILPGIDESLTGQRMFMLQVDPPNHPRLRKLVSAAFTPRAIKALRDKIGEVTDACLDTVAPRGELDVVKDLALPVPSTLICEMMGVPLADRERFTVWTAQATFGLAAAIMPPEVVAQARAAGEALGEYFQGLIAARRGALTDDILSNLIRAEEAGDRLSSEELLSQAIGLLIAGFETTIGLISNGVRCLLQHPDELARLRKDPALIGTAVDECLRYDGPIVLTPRILHVDAEFGGKTIPKNSMVWSMLAAANRDPDVFADAERFDVGRRPNEHLAFGGGPHFCLGSHLAKLEGEIAIGRLVERFDDLELAPGFEWGASLFRVPGRLPVRFRAKG
jgi:cytochrome P450